MYICDFSRSVGAGSATTRNTRGLDALGDRLDRAALAGAVATFEHDADLQSRMADPLLQLHQLDVQRSSSFSYSLPFIGSPESAASSRVCSSLSRFSRLPCLSCLLTFQPSIEIAAALPTRLAPLVLERLARDLVVESHHLRGERLILGMAPGNRLPTVGIFERLLQELNVVVVASSPASTRALMDRARGRRNFSRRSRTAWMVPASLSDCLFMAQLQRRRTLTTGFGYG